MAETKKSLPSNDRLRDKNRIRKNDLTQLLAGSTPNVKSKPDYLPDKLDWMTAICPICGKKYPQLPDYKPSTCGVFECVYSIANKRLEEKEAKSNENNS